MNVRSEIFASQGEDNEKNYRLFYARLKLKINSGRIISSVVKMDYWLNTVQQSLV